MRGRIFKVNKAKKELIEVTDFINPAGRMAEHTVLSGAPGRTHDRKGQGRHKLENREASKEHAKETFAAELSKYLEDNYESKNFRRLILVAPPKFLGYMRNQLSNLQCNNVITHVSKDLTKQEPSEIYSHLSKQITSVYSKPL